MNRTASNTHRFVQITWGPIQYGSLAVSSQILLCIDLECLLIDNSLIWCAYMHMLPARIKHIRAKPSALSQNPSQSLPCMHAQVYPHISTRARAIF